MLNIVKITTIINPLELLAPHSCRGCGRIGDILCDCCKNNIISNHKNYCPNCKTLKNSAKCSKCRNLPPVYIINRKSSPIGDLIKEFKYSSTRAIARPIAEILNQILPDFGSNTIIVSLPTITPHIRQRGFDHTYLIAKQLTRLRPDLSLKRLLLRNQNTVQVGADRTTRISQATKAYQINPKISINPKSTYILFDDVWTTGASMKSAIKKLRQAGARKIIIVALSVS